MTDTNDDVTIVEKIVVVFDICSSSKVLEGLILSDNQRYWRDLIVAIKQHLSEESEKYGFEVYKFLGDGWILLFDPANVDGSVAHLIPVLHRLIHHYSAQYRLLVRKHLHQFPSIEGLTFGLDVGKLIRMRMSRKTEFVGRAINVASRLQSAVKDDDEAPQGKALVSNPLFHKLKPFLRGFLLQRAKRELRNLATGEFECRKIDLATKDDS